MKDGTTTMIWRIRLEMVRREKVLGRMRIRLGVERDGLRRARGILAGRVQRLCRGVGGVCLMKTFDFFFFGKFGNDGLLIVVKSGCVLMLIHTTGSIALNARVWMAPFFIRSCSIVLTNLA
jgi:hypothetical protein